MSGRSTVRVEVAESSQQIMCSGNHERRAYPDTDDVVTATHGPLGDIKGERKDRVSLVQTWFVSDRQGVVHRLTLLLVRWELTGLWVLDGRPWWQFTEHHNGRGNWFEEAVAFPERSHKRHELIYSVQRTVPGFDGCLIVANEPPLLWAWLMLRVAGSLLCTKWAPPHSWSVYKDGQNVITERCCKCAVKCGRPFTWKTYVVAGCLTLPIQLPLALVIGWTLVPLFFIPCVFAFVIMRVMGKFAGPVHYRCVDADHQGLVYSGDGADALTTRGTASMVSSIVTPPTAANAMATTLTPPQTSPQLPVEQYFPQAGLPYGTL